MRVPAFSGLLYWASSTSCRALMETLPARRRGREICSSGNRGLPLRSMTVLKLCILKAGHVQSEGEGCPGPSCSGGKESRQGMVGAKPGPDRASLQWSQLCSLPLACVPASVNSHESLLEPALRLAGEWDPWLIIFTRDPALEQGGKTCSKETRFSTEHSPPDTWGYLLRGVASSVMQEGTQVRSCPRQCRDHYRKHRFHFTI